jgi:hypothetical protein
VDKLTVVEGTVDEIVVVYVVAVPDEVVVTVISSNVVDGTVDTCVAV